MWFDVCCLLCLLFVVFVEVRRCWLLVVRCAFFFVVLFLSLSVGCRLSIVACRLSCLWFVVCLSFVVWCLMFAVCRLLCLSLFVGRCLLFVVCLILFFLLVVDWCLVAVVRWLLFVVRSGSLLCGWLFVVCGSLFWWLVFLCVHVCLWIGCCLLSLVAVCCQVLFVVERNLLRVVCCLLFVGCWFAFGICCLFVVLRSLNICCFFCLVFAGACCSLLVIRCSFCAVRRLSCVAGYVLVVVRGLWLDVCCKLLFVVCGLLFVACSLLLVSWSCFVFVGLSFGGVVCWLVFAVCSSVFVVWVNGCRVVCSLFVVVSCRCCLSLLVVCRFV